MATISDEAVEAALTQWAKTAGAYQPWSRGYWPDDQSEVRKFLVAALEAAYPHITPHGIGDDVAAKLEEIRHQLRVNVEIIKRDKPDPLPHILPHEIEILTGHVFDRLNELEAALQRNPEGEPIGWAKAKDVDFEAGGHVQFWAARDKSTVFDTPLYLHPPRGQGAATTRPPCDSFIADPCGSSRCASCGKRRAEHRAALSPKATNGDGV